MPEFAGSHLRRVPGYQVHRCPVSGRFCRESSKPDQAKSKTSPAGLVGRKVRTPRRVFLWPTVPTVQGRNDWSPFEAFPHEQVSCVGPTHPGNLSWGGDCDSPNSDVIGASRSFELLPTIERLVKQSQLERTRVCHQHCPSARGFILARCPLATGMQIGPTSARKTDPHGKPFDHGELRDI